MTKVLICYDNIMKAIIRTFLSYVIALWAITQILGSSLTIGNDLKTWGIAALALMLLNTLLKPILTILFLPIQLFTLGLFSIVVNALVFYLFLRLLPQITISSWTFPGLAINGLSIPETQLPVIGTIFVASTLISLITNFIAYLVE